MPLLSKIHKLHSSGFLVDFCFGFTSFYLLGISSDNSGITVLAEPGNLSDNPFCTVRSMGMPEKGIEQFRLFLHIGGGRVQQLL
jgi:hypothetical protein